MITQPEPHEVLIKFYRKVHPEGPGWNEVAAEAGLSHAHESGGLVGQFANWILGCVLIYSTLFGLGKLIFHEYSMGLLFVLVAVVSAWFISRNLSKLNWKSDNETPDQKAASSVGG